MTTTTQITDELQELRFQGEFEIANQKEEEILASLENRTDIDSRLTFAGLLPDSQADRAEQILLEILAAPVTNEQRSTAFYHLGNLAGDHEERIGLYRTAIALNPANTDAINMLADELMQEETAPEHEEGLRLLHKTSLQYNNPHIYSSLIHHVILGRVAILYKQCISLSKTLCEQNPTDAMRHYDFLNLLGLDGQIRQLLNEIPTYIRLEEGRPIAPIRFEAIKSSADPVWKRMVEERLSQPESIQRNAELSVLFDMLGAGPWHTAADYFFDAATKNIKEKAKLTKGIAIQGEAEKVILAELQKHSATPALIAILKSLPNSKIADSQ